MKKENVKYLVIPVVIILAYIAWYYWNKSKTAVVATVAATATTPATGTIAANTNPGAVTDNYYQYGSGKIYFADRAPSTYKDTSLLSFTPDLLRHSAFKSN